MKKGKQEKFEIWGDVVELRDLIISILLSSGSTMGAYFLAPSDDKTKQLFFGLAGAVIGFILSTLFIKPKRIVTIEDEQENS
ncbi:MAG: hypothetical protein ABS916_06120 [Carnobacterium sp.]|uniref:Uncharacterized protein n=1 Tax=Carnobacterium viridans TaxID=174587 RepID=A0A1H0YZH4_9LACT|nr:hypothetical protein [Carnobacterium viridans]UDE94867.1 hypothetical protein LHA31_09940 [Carnobacterium viridans]SDQ20677.1 hypothetical protein SAMN04487752_1240 [Carnobacterium viridans]